MELLKDVSDSEDKYSQIWAALECRFGYMNEPQSAMQRFDDAVLIRKLGRMLIQLLGTMRLNVALFLA